MQQSVNVLNEGSNPTEARNGNDIDLLLSGGGGDSFQRNNFDDSVRNTCSSTVASDKNIRPASLPIKKCFNYTEEDAVGSGSGKADDEFELNQSQAEAAFLSPSEGHFFKRYAEVSKFSRKDNNAADFPAKNRRRYAKCHHPKNGLVSLCPIITRHHASRLFHRSDTSFMLAKQRLSSFSTTGCGVGGQQEANVETMDDDLAPLLPSKRELSQEDIYHVRKKKQPSTHNLCNKTKPPHTQSQTSLVSSSEGGILAEGEETSSEDSQVSDGNSSRSPACVLGLVERLLRTHPVWFLPGIQRSGAVHLLQGKEEGVSGLVSLN